MPTTTRIVEHIETEGLTLDGNQDKRLTFNSLIYTPFSKAWNIGYKGMTIKTIKELDSYFIKRYIMETDVPITHPFIQKLKQDTRLLEDYITSITSDIDNTLPALNTIKTYSGSSGSTSPLDSQYSYGTPNTSVKSNGTIITFKLNPDTTINQTPILLKNKTSLMN